LPADLVNDINIVLRRYMQT